MHAQPESSTKRSPPFSPDTLKSRLPNDLDSLLGSLKGLIGGFEPLKKSLGWLFLETSVQKSVRKQGKHLQKTPWSSTPQKTENCESTNQNIDDDDHHKLKAFEVLLLWEQQENLWNMWLFNDFNMFPLMFFASVTILRFVWIPSILLNCPNSNVSLLFPGTDGIETNLKTLKTLNNVKK